MYGSVQLLGQVVSDFTMNDIENGRVKYIHSGDESRDGQTISDEFKVKVTDGTHNRFFVFPDMEKPTRRAQKVRCPLPVARCQLPVARCPLPVASYLSTCYLI